MSEQDNASIEIHSGALQKPEKNVLDTKNFYIPSSLDEIPPDVLREATQYILSSLSKRSGTTAETTVRESDSGSEDFFTTNPENHDPRHFRYIVHALNPSARILLGMFRAQYEASKAAKGQEANMDYPYSPVENPEKFVTRAFISCSVIDQDHLGTWGEAGVIIEAREANILTTSPTDAGTIPTEDLDYRQKDEELLPFRELLSQTATADYNETVIRGRPPIKISAVFVKYYFDGENYVTLDSESANQVEMLAATLHIPVVEIRIPKVPDSVLELEQVDSPYAKTYTLKMGRNGKLFNLFFTKFDDKEEILMGHLINAHQTSHRTMTREERETFLQEIEERLSDNETPEEMRKYLQMGKDFLNSAEASKRDYRPALLSEQYPVMPQDSNNSGQKPIKLFYEKDDN